MIPDVTVDARNRALRTFLQGIGIDVLLAIAAALLLWLPDADVSKKEAWLVLCTAVVKSVLTAAASYVMRAKLDQVGGLTPRPPDEAGAFDLVLVGCLVAILGLLLLLATTLDVLGLVLIVVGILVALYAAASKGA